jgi:hypothetical protein
MWLPSSRANSASCLALQTTIVTVQMKTTWIQIWSRQRNEFRDALEHHLRAPSTNCTVWQIGGRRCPPFPGM